MDFKSTLNLPDAEFAIPMKADLPTLEPALQAEWDAQQIYHRIQESRAGAPAYVLHDGPPYTNSPIHIGTALNKILKDFVVKSHTMMGFRAPYVPGFDNHGLPIEQTVMRAFHEKKQSPSVVELRKACRAHAREYIDVQTKQFKRLGVFGLWERPYTTMDFRFEAEIVRVFKRMVEGGYVYKGLRPTLWSPTSRTALADTEIVYHDHTSKAIYVRFPLREDPNQFFTDYPNLYTVIWTTTPWTIPANLAVAFHPEMEYAIAKVGDAHYLLLEALLPKVAEKVGWANYEIVQRLQGINMDRAVFKHPLWDRDSLGVMASYVTTEDGTGVVHTAPGHGRDDFYTGQAYHLPVLCPVDERGYMTDGANEFAGAFYKDCDNLVVERLREEDNLLAAEDYQHSYPYAERDDKPVIYRATEQWFVKLDHEDLRMRMLDQIKLVDWVPSTGQTRIHSMILGRPDWCISRQRPWGVGIPIFYGKNSNEPCLDAVAIEAVAKLVEQEGSDAWFEKDPKDILPAGYEHPETGETEFRKETDVLDVWFDSGSTCLCVMEGNVEPQWKEELPVDIYLEGSDQHRGWFNSSLVIGTATMGQAPYKQVVTHGFVVDEKGIKLSKRLMNSLDPDEVAKTYGIDVLRYWVASVDYAYEVPCYDALLKSFGEHYRRVRNTLRFLMGNVGEYDPNSARPKLLEIDEWALEQTELLVEDCVEAYKAHRFSAVINGVHNFCVNELSSFYLDAIKDRMYCEEKSSDVRKSGQYTCYQILMHLNRLLAPVLVHTAEEVRRKLGAADGLPSVHAEEFAVPSRERLMEIEDSNLQERFASVLELRKEVFAAFEIWKVGAQMKDGQDAIVTIGGVSDNVKSFNQEDLATYLKFSWVEVSDEDGISFRPSEYPKCERSRLRRPDVEVVDGVALRPRDRQIVAKLQGAV